MTVVASSPSVTPLTQRSAWHALQAHYRDIKDTHLRELFAQDPDRAERPSLEGAGLLLDYSKHRITNVTIDLLTALARECGPRRAP